MLLALILLASAGAAPALETARGLAASGAPQLALARVEQLQPREPAAPRWGEWEALRLALLVDLKRNDEALKRAAALPDNMPQPVLRLCLLAAARAAVAAGQSAQARAYSARLLWQLDPAAEEARAARLLVIESYLADEQGETAFRAMLRYEQDYRPLERDTAGRFVGALLDLALDKEAVNWLASLEDASAMKLRLQLRTGLIGPDAAIAQARAQLVRYAKTGGGTNYWQVLAEAATRQGNGALRIEALERLLNHAGGNDARGPRTPAKELWQGYLTEAQATANRNQLLAGDDPAWTDFAARRLGANPYESRALFAYLMRTSKSVATRFGAELQLAFSLYQGGLDYAALHLFGDVDIATEALDPQARYLLGEIAETRNAPALSVRFWQGLAAPPNAGPGEWQVRFAVQQWRAGAAEAAVGTMRALAKQERALPGPAASRALALGREMLAAGKPALADEMLAALLPLVTGEPARDMLYALGGIAESGAKFERAADYYLRSALARGLQAPDASALQARLAAAANLARAGFREDARAQFQWVIGNSKDAAQIEFARREMSRL
jgi:hypothetical protein